MREETLPSYEEREKEREMGMCMFKWVFQCEKGAAVAAPKTLV